ncbi:MAG TPA: hypothetical protein PKC22_09815 [Rhodocyclaceae bacterium]|nr:hypothetical protein [Rhodocyclaceae bacterium]
MTNPQPAAETKVPFFAVRDIHAYYGESYIVQGVSFEIAEVDIVAPRRLLPHPQAKYQGQPWCRCRQWQSRPIHHAGCAEG